MKLRGPRGDGESIWEVNGNDIVEMESGVICAHCGNQIVAGSTFSVDDRNQRPYHQGCAYSATKNNPIAKVYFKVKSWPRLK